MPPRPGRDRPERGAPRPSLEGAGAAPLREGAPGAALGCVRNGRWGGARTQPGPVRALKMKPSRSTRPVVAHRPARQRPSLVRSHPPSSHAPVRGARGNARAVVLWTFADRGSAVAERSDRLGGRSDHSGPIVREFGLAYTFKPLQDPKKRGSERAGRTRERESASRRDM